MSEWQLAFLNNILNAILILIENDGIWNNTIETDGNWNDTIETDGNWNHYNWNAGDGNWNRPILGGVQILFKNLSLYLN